MYVIVTILLILLYILLGIVVWLMHGLVTDNYVPDFDDFISGELEPEEQNKMVMFLTFWPITLVYYLIRFFIKVVIALYKAIVWYIKALISAGKDFLKKGISFK